VHARKKKKSDQGKYFYPAQKITEVFLFNLAGTAPLPGLLCVKIPSEILAVMETKGVSLLTSCSLANHYHLNTKISPAKTMIVLIQGASRAFHIQNLTRRPQKMDTA